MSTRSRALRLLDDLAARLAPTTSPRPRSDNPFAGLFPWELRSRASLDVPRRAHGVDTQYAAELLDFAGVCAFSRAIDGALAAQCRHAADSLAGEVRAAVRAHSLDPDDPVQSFRFDGAYQRGPGRVDLRDHEAMGRPPFDHESLRGEAAWMPLVTRVLGEGARLLWRGVVVTEPNTPEQPFHSDGPLVSKQEWRKRGVAVGETAAAPPHSLIVFVPLVRCDSRGEVRPTSFLPGSHHQVTANALQAETVEAGCSSGAGMPAVIDAEPGDAIVFDMRTHHAGGANTSRERRSVLYFTYALPWYDAEMQRELLGSAGLVQRGAAPAPKLTPAPPT
ncbi:hypothetical protein AB1Y20_007657 [Prymnesium parvum]|uniref:Phytanoyl-CoA dioxygenase n=1 Tax=Prymnesium parvum TaxID=97485 RepID=A0AB34IVI1_PRYPA